jgi:hypothetical protein
MASSVAVPLISSASSGDPDAPFKMMMQNYGFSDHGLPYAWGLGFGFCCLPPPFPGGVPQLGRTKLTRKTIDDITELANGENRRCIRGIAGLKAAVTTALKRYANIFLWLARRRNIIVSSIYVHAWLFYSDMKYGCKVVRGFLGYAHPHLVVFFRYEI